jgi:hypothetical protein
MQLDSNWPAEGMLSKSGHTPGVMSAPRMRLSGLLREYTMVNV